MSKQEQLPSYLYEGEAYDGGTSGKKHRVGLFAGLAVVLVLALAAGGFYYYAKSTCEKALEQEDALEFAKAAETFRGIPLGERLFPIESEYIAAGELTAAEDYDAAIKAFKSLGIYREAPAALKQTRYLQAGQVLESGAYMDAAALYEALGDYRDAADKAIEAQLMRADALADGGNFESAKELLGELIDEGCEQAGEALIAVYKRSAADYAEKEQYIKACNELLELEAKADVDVERQIARYRKKAYDSAVSDYRAGDYAASTALMEALGDYEDAETYLFLANVHTKTAWVAADALSAVQQLAVLILKEDAAELLVSRQALAEQFLAGYWEGDGGYFSMESDGYISYDLPYVDYGDYYYIEDGVVLLYPEDDPYATKELFSIRVITVDCIQVYAYADGETYTLFRS